MDRIAVFEAYENGVVHAGEQVLELADMPWLAHAEFEGVELKHLLVGASTGDRFSYHLVRIGAGKKIGWHRHEFQTETHEVIAGSGHTRLENNQLPYSPGVIAMIEAGVSHEVVAGEDGLCLFAKFMPALC